jgi:hypothetical protein
LACIIVPTMKVGHEMNLPASLRAAVASSCCITAILSWLPDRLAACAALRVDCRPRGCWNPGRPDTHFVLTAPATIDDFARRQAGIWYYNYKNLNVWKVLSLCYRDLNVAVEIGAWGKNRR